MRFTGKLHTWQEERGFGFIRPLDGGQDIFVHVSNLPMPRPGPEEVLTFEVTPGRQGKKQASNVRRQEVEAAGLAADRARDSQATRRKQDGARHRRAGRSGRMLIALALMAVIGWFAFDAYQAKRSRAAQSMPAPELSEPRDAASRLRCDGRTMCSQMTSCQEATFFRRTARARRWMAMATAFHASSNGASEKSASSVRPKVAVKNPFVVSALQSPCGIRGSFAFLG